MFHQTGQTHTTPSLKAGSTIGEREISIHLNGVTLLVEELNSNINRLFEQLKPITSAQAASSVTPGYMSQPASTDLGACLGGVARRVAETNALVLGLLENVQL